MRPRGEIRQAIGEAAQALAAEAGAATWRDMAQRAQVGWQAARLTVKNMATAGELQRVGTKRMPGVSRPLVTYAPARNSNFATATTGGLDALMRAWR